LSVAEKSILQAVREEVGLTREQVCALLDPVVATKTLERWEKGTTPISDRRMGQLALVYRVPRSRLVTR
jgi:DNA-binding transcriptional regulator YiaG